jgi:beta-glucanase (GH16 family)
MIRFDTRKQILLPLAALCIGVLPASASAAVTVTASSPTNGATLSSPVTFSAHATSHYAITGWIIYVDSAKAYSAGRTSSISTSLPISAGTHKVVIRAWNSRGQNGSAYLSINVVSTTSAPSPIAITTSALPGATVGTGYSAALKATGGVPPYTWSLASGTLPAGLSLSSSGVISGTPTLGGTSYFSVAAKDSAASPQAAMQSESITTALATQATPPPQAAGYNLSFQDDFNSLNLSPNGYGSYSWYNPGVWWENAAPYANISATNSILNLNWLKGQSPADTSVSTSAKDGSYHRAWRYGYFEVRMRWDTVTGAWPAIWMIPVQNITNPTGEHGEIDIFEGQGATPNMFFGTIHDWMGSTDLRNNAGSNYHTFPSTVDMSQYHTYGVLWVPGQITWYFDNQPLFSASTYPIFDQQDYYLILGSQEGANWSYGNLSGVTASKIGVNVDWVRVWQK